MLSNYYCQCLLSIKPVCSIFICLSILLHYNIIVLIMGSCHCFDSLFDRNQPMPDVYKYKKEWETKPSDTRRTLETNFRDKFTSQQQIQPVNKTNPKPQQEKKTVKEIKQLEIQLQRRKNSAKGIQILIALAIVHERQQNEVQALAILQRALEQLQHLKRDEQTLAYIHLRIANICIKSGSKLPMAERYLKEAYDIYMGNQSDNQEEIIIVLNSQGALREKQQHFKQSQQFYRKSIQIQQNIFAKNDERLLLTQSNLAGVLFENKDYKSSFDTYRICLHNSLRDSQIYQILIANCHHNLCTVAQRDQNLIAKYADDIVRQYFSNEKKLITLLKSK